MGIAVAGPEFVLLILAGHGDHDFGLNDLRVDHDQMCLAALESLRATRGFLDLEFDSRVWGLEEDLALGDERRPDRFHRLSGTDQTEQFDMVLLEGNTFNQGFETFEADGDRFVIHTIRNRAESVILWVVVHSCE